MCLLKHDLSGLSNHGQLLLLILVPNGNALSIQFDNVSATTHGIFLRLFLLLVDCAGQRNDLMRHILVIFNYLGDVILDSVPV